MGRAPSEEGYRRKNYWVGPRSKSYYAKGFFRYAYYFNEKQGYIVNGIVRDDRVYGADLKNTLEDLFEHLENEVPYIDRVALIDLQAYEKAYNNNFINPEAPVNLYGSFGMKVLQEAGLAPEDLYSVGSDRSFDILYEGQKRVIFVSPLEDGGKKYLLGILLDEGDRSHFVKGISAAFVFFLVFTLGVLYLGIFVIVKKYSSLLTFEKERNSEIETFTKNIAMLPENIYKCRRRDGELMLTYNYGRAIDKEEEISFESAYRPLRDFYPADYVEEFRRLTEGAFNGHPARFQISADGNHFEHFVSPILDEDGNVIEIIGIATNINDRRLEEEQARYLATHDYLTDLANRREFEDRVKKKVDENPDGSFALMILDLDDFKIVNDSYGHLAGDAVLTQFADRLKGIMKGAPEKIFAARMGGDEFALFCSPENREDAERIAEKIIRSSMKSYEIRGRQINLGMSMGVALKKGPGINYREMLYSADAAMYRAKKSAGNTCVFYEEGMEL
ncbi:MAG: diguanylate cyclase domain-containing protein [Aminivibrio sp.]